MVGENLRVKKLLSGNSFLCFRRDGGGGGGGRETEVNSESR